MGAADLIGGRSEMLRVNIYNCPLRCEKITLVGPSPFPVDLHQHQMLKVRIALNWRAHHRHQTWRWRVVAVKKSFTHLLSEGLRIHRSAVCFLKQLF